MTTETIQNLEAKARAANLWPGELFGEKIRQMSKLAENQADLAKVDQRTYGKLPYAGYADQQAKADVESEIAGKQKMIALSKAELAALSGKRGMELAQKTVQSERIKKQVEEIKNQQMMVAQYGKIGATIRQNAAISMLYKGALGAAAAYTAVGAIAKTTSHAASPVHGEMLDKSIELFKAQVGTLLLPAVTGMSASFQQAAAAAGNLADNVPDGFKRFLRILNDPIGNFRFLWAKATGQPVPEDIGRPPLRPATMPAHFEPFDQAWKRIQQEAASRGPLEQQIFDIQMQNLPAQTAALQQIATNTNPQQQPPAPPQLPI